MPAPQRSIRIPDELAEVIEAEAKRRGRPWTFSSVLVEAAQVGVREMGASPTEAAQHANGLGKGYAAPRPKGGKR